ncbi:MULTISPECIES: hypothetical protein [unclassified Rathayibacter]|uniref:hypothetical protein n=1 Tax=unclassified Rathayibacter TaxID=2609250 RepID=UPI000CE77559|nr:MULTISPECIES: hypothetical protein [unclassified Rathayibacter]PPF16180.1 hypothetical protein C5B92_12385 [Rathayibacter sp. AY1A4]PPG77977.1 hypothetical protein C5C52_13910 [Rathayibacter sp. AY1E5]PPH28144.1 hypothetical protein C5C94_14200 [Rathayibacter sp. AY1C3]PPH64018.1 hypothetical protein C5D25_06345 [Rathayibacter sp. AY1D7]PPI29933.1 hypothetical protein C5D66_10015 [Rathayibacter sp. AY1B4]
MADQHGSVRLPAVARPRALVAFLVSVLLVGAVGVGVGASLRSADDLDAAAEQPPPPVEVEVERRSIEPPRTVQGVVDPGDIRTVPFAGISAPAVLPYVTEVGTPQGGVLASGGLLLAVAGRPLLGLRVTAPLYRDLHVGDSGPDAEAFEVALSALSDADFAVDGTVTEATVAAADALWRERGYRLPTETVASPAGGSSDPGATSTPGPTPPPTAVTRPFVDVTQIVQLESDSVTVLSAPAVGATASSEEPLAVLQTSPRRITARATVIDAEALQAGTPVVLHADGRPERSGAVVRQGDFVAADSTAGSASGRDLFLDLPEDWADLGDKASVVVSAARAGDPVLAVPLTAVHRASTAPFVVVGRSSRYRTGEEVPVTVLGVGDGWAHLDESTGPAEGDTVVVTP